MLTRIQFINILQHTALSQTLIKQLYSAGSPVTWGSLETRELIGFVMALKSLFCADVPLSNYSLTHSLS